MEDDDEFGDLYTDVLSTFPSSSSTVHPPRRSIDLNRQLDDIDAINSDFTITRADENGPSANVATENSKPEEEEVGRDSKALETRVLQTADLNLAVLGEEKEQKFVIEEDLGSESAIPGLNTASDARPEDATKLGSWRNDAGGGEGDDWDSDSEDDLRIVLNDNHGPMGMDANGMPLGTDDEDEDGEPLVIVADAAAAAAAAEEQDWGEEAGQSAEGKETTDAAKPNGGLPSAPKIGYSNYGYHPFHSQFKYVRPGAAPLPGGPPVGPGGGPGQVRPPVNMSTVAGRGRGDWRPSTIKGSPMQKGFHSAFWGSNVPGRGLEFTLPSHKTIFDVDIDSFEEKPWKYPGVDVSDFFNFNFDEESWKEYCKQLEQLRLESTMQSKIRVYESGRAEQEYDPDLPPELAAAASIHDSSAENTDTAKADGGLGDLAKGSARARPPLPIGRSIQVETGYGERLPSVDTRPPRIRDSDAVIEIVLQDSVDDESAGNGAVEHPDNGSAREDNQVNVVEEDRPEEGDEYFERCPSGYDVMKEDGARKRSPIMDSPRSNIHDEEKDGSSPQRASSDCHPGSRGHAPIENVDSSYEERCTREKACERSPRMSLGESALDRRSLDYQREDSIESMEGKHSLQLSSRTPVEDVGETSSEGRAAANDDIAADIKSGKRKEDTNVVASTNTSKDKHSLHSTKQQKLNSQNESPADKEVDERADFRASRSSDNSKATGSSRDNQKRREGIDEEVVQNRRSTFTGDVKRHRGEGGYDLRRKDRDGRMETERNYMLAKGREEHYSLRDWDPYAANHFHAKSEGSDQRKGRDYSEVSWQRRDEDPHGRRIRAEDTRKQERADEMVSRQRGKVKEIERSEKDEYLYSRKALDNGSWRGYHEKDVGLRYREKDDGLKSRHEILDDHHSKRRKDDEHLRGLAEKEDILLVHRDSSSTRRKRDRDGILSQRKRDDQSGVRGNMDDRHSVRLKDEVWVHRERAEQQRDLDEWCRAKQPYEENMSRREREDGRAPTRSSRDLKEKTWVGHSRGREEYKGHDKDTGRHGEQLKRREQVEEETSLQYRGGEDVYTRGNQFGNEAKRSRQERSSARNDLADNAPDNHRLHGKKNKDNLKKARESEDHSMSGSSKRQQGEKGTANEVTDPKGMGEQAVAEHSTSLHNLTREGREVISSDDEQHGSKRGRSKLERWTSHKERQYDVNSRSSSVKKEMSKDKYAGSGSFTAIDDESAKRVEAGESDQSLAGRREAGGSEGKDGEAKPTDDRHLDTVEKLKRRSERFKLPLTSEKDPPATKESEPLPSSQNEIPANAQVKQERPPRKRRWINS